MRQDRFPPLLVGVIALLGFAACSAGHLPPGTLPPEYEPPVVAPWLAVGSDAGMQSAPAPNDAATAELAPAKAPPAPELSPDAGVK